MEIPPWLWFRLPVGMAVAVRVGVFVDSGVAVRVGGRLGCGRGLRCASRWTPAA